MSADTDRLRALRPYADLAASPQWSDAEADARRDLEKTRAFLFSDHPDLTPQREHDELVRARAVSSFLDSVRARAAEYARLRERLDSPALPVPGASPIAESP